MIAALVLSTLLTGPWRAVPAEGVKMLVTYFDVHIPIGISLGVVALSLGASTVDAQANAESLEQTYARLCGSGQQNGDGQIESTEYELFLAEVDERQQRDEDQPGAHRNV